MNTTHCFRCVTPQKCAIFGCCPGTWPAEGPGHACLTCHQPLDQPGKPETQDCGGDCVRCMAEAGDTDCLDVMRTLEPHNPQWVDHDADSSPDAPQPQN